MDSSAEAVIAQLNLLLLAGSVAAWIGISVALRQRRPIVAPEPRVPVPWRGFDVFVLIVSYLAFEILAGGLAGSLAGEAGQRRIVLLLALQSLTRVAWFIFATAFLLVRGAYVEDLGWDFSRLRGDLKIGAWLFLAAVVPVFLVQLFFTEYLDIPSEHPLLKLTQDAPSLGIMLLATLAAVGIAPWFEEFVFRVVLQGWLEAEQVRLRKLRGESDSDLPGYAPLIIASVVFAGLHFAAGPDPAAIFVLSLFLGYAYRQTHRIAPSIIIHAGINGLTMLTLWIMYFAG